MRNFRRSESRFTLFTAFTILVCVLGVFIFILISSITISIGVGKSEVLLPSRLNEGNKKPVYFEWKKDQLVSHPSHDTLNFQKNLSEIKTWNESYDYIKQVINADKKYSYLFSKIMQRKDSLFLFVFIRQSGFRNFREFLGFVQNKIKVDIGYELYEENTRIKVRK
ncbi:MAG: hypothetical protein NTX61_07225 [Bacteroidetes bacterium]|nr:hypothetical protein [Bacteroidota bacterium]